MGKLNLQLKIAIKQQDEMSGFMALGKSAS